MLLDRTKIYGWSEKEALINEKNGVPCPNLKSDFDDWLTDDEIRKIFPNQFVVIRVDKLEENCAFTKAQVVYYFCDYDFATRRSWELQDSPDGKEYGFNIFSTWDPRLDGMNIVTDITDLGGE